MPQASSRTVLYNIEGLTGDALIGEGERILRICNSCRYCEGYCAVFPAMERRLSFTAEDVRFLANLCHNCAECYYACQYAPPHEFAVNVPQVFAMVRKESYERWASPRFLWKALKGWGVVLIWLLAAGVIRWSADAEPNDSTFYGVIPHEWMVAIFLTASVLVALAKLASFLKFWRESGYGVGVFFSPETLVGGLRDAFTLKNLSSGGAGCTYPDEHHSNARRWFHHLTFYGFLLCFASTTVAALYHFAGEVAPYPYLSLPVVLGMLGGVGLLIGPAGLYVLKLRRDPNIVDGKQDGMDLRFLVMLFLTSVSGLLLMILRGSGAMSGLLMVHLTIVLVLFLTLPYGKFVHALYRTAALVRDAIEKRTMKPAHSGE
jgi:citrate/tricarballylate utilization protein